MISVGGGFGSKVHYILSRSTAHLVHSSVRIQQLTFCNKYAPFRSHLWVSVMLFSEVPDMSSMFYLLFLNAFPNLSCGRLKNIFDYKPCLIGYQHHCRTLRAVGKYQWIICRVRIEWIWIDFISSPNLSLKIPKNIFLQDLEYSPLPLPPFSCGLDFIFIGGLGFFL